MTVTYSLSKLVNESKTPLGNVVNWLLCRYLSHKAEPSSYINKAMRLTNNAAYNSVKLDKASKTAAGSDVN